MRLLALIVIAALAACASGEPERSANSTLAAARGTALPPPAPGEAGRLRARGRAGVSALARSTIQRPMRPVPNRIRARYAGQAAAQSATTSRRTALPARQARASVPIKVWSANAPMIGMLSSPAPFVAGFDVMPWRAIRKTRWLYWIAAALALGLSACATAPVGGGRLRAPRASTSPIDRRLAQSQRRGHARAFQRTINQRYGAGLQISAVAADLRRNDFTCSAASRGERGDPPAQVCRKTETVSGCTHTWQAHLFDSGNDNRLARTRGLYDRRCGGDGLLGGPGR